MARQKSNKPREKYEGPKIEMATAKASKNIAVKIVGKPANADNTIAFITEAVKTAVEKYGAKSFRGTIVAYK